MHSQSLRPWELSVNMKGSYKESSKNKEQERDAAATESQAEALEAKNFCTADSHFALKTEGA